MALPMLDDKHDSDQYFYHATTRDRYLAILRDKTMQAGSYFACIEIAEYYAECIEDEGENPVILAFPKSAFSAASMEVDHNGLAEPVTYGTLGLKESEVKRLWQKSDRSVAACIDIIGSFQYRDILDLEHGKILS